MTKVLLSVLVLASCAESGTDSRSLGADEETIQSPSASIAALTKNPRRFDQQTVKIVGRVERLSRPGEFFVRGRGWFWAPSVRVLSWDAAPSVAAGDRVKVRGVFHARITDATARELGRTRDEIGEGPIVVATSIERIEQ